MKTRASGTNRVTGLFIFLICIFGLMSGQRTLATLSRVVSRINVPPVSVNPGNIFIADVNAFGGGGGIIRVDSSTGIQATVSSGGIFVEPIGIAIDANGDLIVADWPAFGGSGIVRVNPTTGAQTVVSSGGSLFSPTGIAINASGDILIADDDAFGGGGGIIRVNPVTGSQSTVSSGGLFDNPRGIAIDVNGDLIVVDRDAFGGPGGVIRVNPVTGAQGMIASGGSFDSPSGIAIEANGNILVADHSAFGGPGGVIRVNPVTGAQTTVSSGGVFDAPFGIAVEANGDIVVTDHFAFGGPGAVIRVDPVTGAQTTISSGGSFVDPVGIAIGPAMQGCVQPPLGMVSWWPGDGNTNDISGNEQNGAPHGGVTFSQGKVGQAFLFDGIDGRIEIPDSSILRFGAGDLTVDAWIKAPPSANFRGVIGKEQQSFPGPSIFLRLTDEGLAQFAVTDCGTGGCGFSFAGGGGTRQPIQSPFRVDDDMFHHIAGVRRSSGYELYVDGQLVATRSEPARNSDNTAPLFIGIQAISVNGSMIIPFQGMVDEVEIFNRALSSSEIQSIFNAGSAGKCKNSVPVAMCQDVTVTADSSGTASASIDNGSFDPDSGDTITVMQSPQGSYPIGQTMVTLTVEDNHGASSSCQAAVTVLYNFGGFFPPVNNTRIFNLANAGSAIPMKFSLDGNHGLDISAPGYPASQQIACSDGAPVSTVEETVTAGNSSISYDATTDQYTYVWKTHKSWKGACRQLILKLNDSSIHVANFQFR